MIAVLTGGTGFIGQHLVKRLLTDGHDVRCLVRPGGGRISEDADRFVVQYDEPRSLLKCAALEGADVVFHLAGATKAVRPEAFVAANVTPTRNLLGAITARRLVPRFILVSSQAAAGPASSPSRPIDEDDNPRPVEAYGRSKLEAERVVETFGDRLPVTIVRPCAVYGPSDRDFLTLFRLASRGLLLYPGTASHWMSVLHIADVVDGLIALASQSVSIDRTYFLASSQPVQWRTFGEHIASAAGKRARHVDVFGSLIHTASVAGEMVGRLIDKPMLANRSKATLARQPYWVCSAARARNELGFHERQSLADAVRDTYLWYRQSGWLPGSRGADSAVA